MQHFCISVLSVMIIVVSVAEASYIRKRHGDDDGYGAVFDHVDIERRKQQLNQHRLKVEDFAKNILCQQQYFYDALVEQYHCMKERLIKDLVTSMCTNKGELLIKVVSELFDADQDGYINEYEAQF